MYAVAKLNWIYIVERVWNPPGWSEPDYDEIWSKFIVWFVTKGILNVESRIENNLKDLAGASCWLID